MAFAFRFKKYTMKEISLTKGLVALVDDEDFDRVSQLKWFARKGSASHYASTWVGEWKERQLLHMHHFIIGNPGAGNVIDHRDRDGLNNQKENLRVCTSVQNSANRSPWGASKYLGVNPTNRNGKIKFRAFIGSKGKNKYLGIFKTETEAAAAYNTAAKELHGEFANLNII